MAAHDGGLVHHPDHLTVKDVTSNGVFGCRSTHMTSQCLHHVLALCRQPMSARWVLQPLAYRSVSHIGRRDVRLGEAGTVADVLARAVLVQEDECRRRHQVPTGTVGIRFGGGYVLVVMWGMQSKFSGDVHISNFEASCINRIDYRHVGRHTSRIIGCNRPYHEWNTEAVQSYLEVKERDEGRDEGRDDGPSTSSPGGKGGGGKSDSKNSGGKVCMGCRSHAGGTCYIGNTNPGTSPYQKLRTLKT